MKNSSLFLDSLFFFFSILSFLRLNVLGVTTMLRLNVLTFLLLRGSSKFGDHTFLGDCFDKLRDMSRNASNDENGKFDKISPSILTKGKEQITLAKLAI